MDTVYVAMCADVLHRGHVNLLKNAAQYGRVVVGLLSDRAVASFKRVPFMTYQDRLAVVQDLIYVDEVVQQDATTPAPYIAQMRPEVFVHGDDWCNGRETFVRDSVIAALESYGGKLIEVPYTKGVSSTSLQGRLRRHEIDTRRGSERLSVILDSKLKCRGCSVTTLSELPVMGAAKAKRKAFDFISFRFSSQTDTLDLNLYFEATKLVDKPLIFDAREFPASTKSILERGHIVGAAGIHVDLKTLLADETLLDSLLETTGFDNQILVATATFLELKEICASAPKVLASLDVLLTRVASIEDAHSAEQSFKNICPPNSITTGYEVADSAVIAEDMLPFDRRQIVILHTVDASKAESLLEQIQTVHT